jgi:hypothetical protein
MSGKPWEKYKKVAPTKAGPWGKYSGKGDLNAPLPQEPQSHSWSELPSNIGSSASGVAEGIYNMVRHPIDTVTNLNDAAMGGVERLKPQFLSDWQKTLPWSPSQETLDRQKNVSGALGGALQERYGGLENIKNTMITDPVGSAFDVASLAAGGAGVTAKVSALSKLSSPIAKIAELTNPVNLVAKGTKKGILMAGKTASHPIGVTTGMGADALQEAARAGYRGGEYGDAFRQNMRGHEAQDSILIDARDAMGSMAEKRNADYLKGMASTENSNVSVNTQKIHDALSNLKDSLFVKNKTQEIVSPDGVVSNSEAFPSLEKGTPTEFKKLDDISKLLTQWESHPQGKTPIALDALKQRIAKMSPSPTAENAANERRLVTTMSGAVKDAIVEQVPEYAGAMKQYESAKVLEKELHKSLGLGPSSTADSAMRKLQSTFRNNANTNYGSRVNSVKKLEAAGAPNIMPKLAGQMANTFAPRGLANLGASYAGVASLLSPVVASTLPFMSPRLMAEITHALGRGARQGEKVTSKVNPKIALILNALAQSGDQQSAVRQGQQ